MPVIFGLVGVYSWLYYVFNRSEGWFADFKEILDIFDVGEFKSCI
jgi:hypothetical protein